MDTSMLLIGLVCGGGLLLLLALGVVISLQNRQADRETGAPMASQDVAALQPVGFTSANSPDLASRAEAMLAAGNKAGAVKLYQDEAGLGLREASDTVEKIEKKRYLAQFERAQPQLRAQLVGLLQKDRKMEAIRLYMAANKTGLSEAIQAVEALEKSLKNN